MKTKGLSDKEHVYNYEVGKYLIYNIYCFEKIAGSLNTTNIT